ncbi:pentapeptide repeat-containing protein (plasmid) [Erwinia persicina]|uniref:pentapeptide repeat-containing protein n=1 Tax=Erwinia persicina TaxID=55211 RepID=UPI0030CA5BB3
MAGSDMIYVNRDFSKVRLKDKKLDNLTFQDCTFSHCFFDGVCLRECDFENCTFQSCSVNNVKHAFLKITDCAFSHSLIQGVDLAGIAFPHSFSLRECRLVCVDFTGLQLRKSTFTSSAFNDCAFEECNLSSADFSGSTFNLTEFRHSDLTGSDYTGTEGLDLNHRINEVKNIRIPQDAGIRILKRMGITLS